MKSISGQSEYDKNLADAVRVLTRGGIVVFPTDTAFGVGCRIDDHKAVDRLYKIKERPVTQAVPVLVDGLPMAGEYYSGPDALTVSLMERYWPGQVTVVSWCDQARVYAPVRGQGKTIGLRMPDHPVPLFLIRSLRVPILAPSANAKGGKTPYDFKELDPEFVRRADFVLDGECTVRSVSTVVDTTVSPPRYIRRGYIRIPEAV